MAGNKELAAQYADSAGSTLRSLELGPAQRCWVLVPPIRVDMGRFGYLPMFPRHAQFSSQLSLAPLDYPPPFWPVQRSNRGALDNSGPRTGDSGYHRRSDVVEPGSEEETAPDS